MIKARPVTGHGESRRNEEVDRPVIIPLKNVGLELGGGGFVDAAIDLANIAVEAVNGVRPMSAAVAKRSLDQSQA